MLDLTQILLVIVITTLTILLTFIGVQIIYILREIRKSIEKFNKMLDDAGTITEAISHPISGLGGVVEGLKSGVKAIETVGNFLSKRRKKREEEELAEEE